MADIEDLRAQLRRSISKERDVISYTEREQPERPAPATARRSRADWRLWLVYADWLIERGDIRGQIIGIDHVLSTEALTLTRRGALEEERKARWSEHLSRWGEGRVLPLRSSLWCWHGIPVGLVLRWEDEPLEAFEALLAQPEGRLIVALDLGGEHLSPTDVARLGRSRAALQLTQLDLRSCALGPDGAAALAEGSSLVSIERLDLSGNTLGIRGILALGAHTMPALAALDLAENEIGPDVAALSWALSGPSELSLRYNALGDIGAEALARIVPPGSPLRSLNLAANQIGARGAEHLAGCEGLRELRALDLSVNTIGDAGAAALASSRALGALSSLSLWTAGIGPAGARALGTAEEIPLEYLALTGNRIGPAGAAALASGALGGLEALEIASADLQEEGLRALAGGRLGELHTLDLSGNNLGPEAASVLASSFPSLVKLNAGYNPIGDEGARAIASSQRLAALEELDLPRCQIRDEGARALARADGLARLQKLNLSSNLIGGEATLALAGSVSLGALSELVLLMAEGLRCEVPLGRRVFW